MECSGGGVKIPYKFVKNKLVSFVGICKFATDDVLNGPKSIKL